MSLASMVLADRIEGLMRYYDWWMRLITFGRDEIVRKAVLRHVRPGETLVDVGCGTGTLAIEAARKGARVVGIDRSRPMLDLAREKAARAGVNVDFREGQASLLPLRGELFDVATATFALSEMSPDDAMLALRAMAEAVRPGGRVIIADEVAPQHPALRVFSGLQRFLFAAVGFFVLLLPNVGEKINEAVGEFSPTRRHPWRRVLEDVGLIVREQSRYQGGALLVIAAERPVVLPPLHREPLALSVALPRGVVGVALHAAAWFALPVPVPAGVYRLGSPDPRSPVLLTGNFLASVEAVRHALAGIDCYLIVEDTGGWNVWCASDARRFTAEKAAALVHLYGLEGLAAHRRVILPRLGGRIRPRLEELLQWEVVTGPIEARDLPEFLQERELTPAMRSLDRMYRLRERLRVGALTAVQLPLWLLPSRFLPSSLRGPIWRFSPLASWILPDFHYLLPGRTGIVKTGVLGAGVGAAMLVRNPKRWAQAATVMVTAPLVGWIYQGTSPVVYWKRLWK